MVECSFTCNYLDFDFFITIAIAYEIGEGISPGVAAAVGAGQLGAHGGVDGAERDFAGDVNLIVLSVMCYWGTHGV